MGSEKRNMACASFTGHAGRKGVGQTWESLRKYRTAHLHSGRVVCMQEKNKTTVRSPTRLQTGFNFLLFGRCSSTANSPGLQRPTSFPAAGSDLPTSVGAHCRSPLSRLHPPSPRCKQASNSLRRGDVRDGRVRNRDEGSDAPSDKTEIQQVGAQALRLSSNLRHVAFT